MEGIVVALAVVACPIGMGAMMWFMARGARKDRSGEDAADPGDVTSLREEHARLGAEIERIEGGAPKDPVGAPR